MTENAYLETDKFKLVKTADMEIQIVQKLADGKLKEYKPMKISEPKEAFAKRLMPSLIKIGLIEQADEKDFNEGFVQLMGWEMPAEIPQEIPKIAEEQEKSVPTSTAGVVHKEEQTTLEKAAPELKKVAEEATAVHEAAQKVEEPKPSIVTQPSAVTQPVSEPASEQKPTPQPAQPVQATPVAPVKAAEDIMKKRLKNLREDFSLMGKDQQDYMKMLAVDVYHCSMDELMIRYDEQANKQSYPTHWLAMYAKDARARNADFTKSKSKYVYHAWFADGGTGEVFDVTVPSDVPELEWNKTYKLMPKNVIAICIARSPNVHKMETVTTETTDVIDSLEAVNGQDGMPTAKDIVSQIVKREAMILKGEPKVVEGDVVVDEGFIGLADTKNITHTGTFAISGLIKSVRPFKTSGKSTTQSRYGFEIDDMTSKNTSFMITLTFDKGKNYFMDEDDAKTSEGRNATVFGYMTWKPGTEQYQTPTVWINPEALWLE